MFKLHFAETQEKYKKNSRKTAPCGAVFYFNLWFISYISYVVFGSWFVCRT